MTIGQRVMLARESYDRALARARAKSDSAAWARLLTAAKNLNEALAAQQRRGGIREPSEPLGA